MYRVHVFVGPCCSLQLPLVILVSFFSFLFHTRVPPIGTPRYDASLVHCNSVVYTLLHNCNSVTLFTLLESGILKPGVGIVGAVKIVQQ